MEATLNKLLKIAGLMRCPCAPGVVAEALERLASGDTPLCVLEELARFDPVLAVRAQVWLDSPVTANRDVELIRALLLSLPIAQGMELKSYLKCWRTSIRVASMAHTLAVRSGLVAADLAWGAGLTHNVAAYLQGPDAEAVDAAEVSAAWVAGFDTEGWLADAVRFHAVPLARGKAAHPLVRVVQLAYVLSTRDQALDSVDVRASLTALGLGVAEGAHWLTDTLEETDALAARFGLAEMHVHPDTAYGRLAHVYAGEAAQSALRDYLSQTDTVDALDRALAASLRMLFGVNAACVFVPNPEGMLRVATVFDPLQALTRLAIAEDDSLSVLSRAMRESRPLRFDSQAPEFAVVDREVARCLGVSDYLCQPVMMGRRQPAVLICGDMPDATSTLWQSFVRAWADAHVRLEVALPGASATNDAIPRERVRRAIHEVANPLTVMRNYVNLLSVRPGMDASVQRDLAIIGDEIERVARIVRGITQAEEAASATHPGELVSVNSIVSELVRMTLGTLLAPNKVSVEIDLNPAIPALSLDKDQVKQVLFNLAKNAVEAMPHGGHLKFTTRLIDFQGQRQIEMEVADTGPGLPDAIRAHLYEPIESGKGGDHAGVGLVISRNLVTRMGGRIECETGASGTRFLIRLPTLEPAVAASSFTQYGSI